MADHNIPLIIMMVLAIILLFVAMVLSAMASQSVKNECPKDDKGRKYSLYSAVVAGVAVFMIFISLMLYIFRQPVIAKMGEYGGSAAQAIQGHADALKAHAEALSNVASSSIA